MSLSQEKPEKAFLRRFSRVPPSHADTYSGNSSIEEIEEDSDSDEDNDSDEDDHGTEQDSDDEPW